MPSAKKQRLNNNAAFVTRGPASVTPTPSFVEDQRALLDHANASAHAVNESMTAANAHDANGITQLLINRAYRHAVMDNSELHGTNPGTMLVTWGSDDSSQLGQVAYLDLPEKEKKTEYPPVPLNFNKKIRAVTCHGLGSAALSVSGQVYSWGVNDEGALGRQTKTDTEETVPGKVVFPNNVIQVQTGEIHITMLTLDGEVYTGGAYRAEDKKFFVQGDLKETDGQVCREPLRVSFGGKKVANIYSGSSTPMNAAKMEDESLWTWGMGINGNLGRSKTMRSPDPITGKFDVSPSFYIKDAQQINVDTIRNKYLTPAPVVWPVGTPKKSVMHVACGAMHMLVVARTTGQFASMVYACGMNANGQLGIRNDVLTKEVEEVHELTPIPALNDKYIVKVAAGKFHSLALDCFGINVYGWGNNRSGACGCGYKQIDRDDELIPVPTRVPFPFVNDAPVVIDKIAAGDAHSMAITDMGKLYTWGFGEQGALGHNSTNDCFVPKELDLNRRLAPYKRDPSNIIVVLDAAGGAQHSIALVKEFRKA